MEHEDIALDRTGINRLIEGLQDCVTGIDHIAVAVPDLAEAIDWYTNKLGFHLVEERETRGERTSMLSAVVTAGSAVIVPVASATAASMWRKEPSLFSSMTFDPCKSLLVVHVRPVARTSLLPAGTLSWP